MGAMILAGLHAQAKNSCVEVLTTGTTYAGPKIRSESQRETLISQRLHTYFQNSPLEPTATGRLMLIPEEGRLNLASDEFDELLLYPLAEALGKEQRIQDLILSQVSTKVNKAVMIIFHEGQAVEVRFYNPRQPPAKNFAKSEFSGRVSAVPFSSLASKQLLANARAANLIDEDILNYYQPQAYTTYCGIASSCVVLGTVRATPLNQDTLLRWNHHVKPEAVVKAQLGDDPGFQLDQLVRLLNSRNEKAIGIYAEPGRNSSIHLREDIVAHMQSKTQKIIVNFHGLTLGALSGGHFSPIAAFDPTTEMVLIMDTAAHKNEPFWIPVDDLYYAMTKIDKSSGRARGWIRVQKKRQSRN